MKPLDIELFCCSGGMAEGRSLESIFLEANAIALILGSQGTALMYRIRGAAKAPELPDGTPAGDRTISTAEAFNFLARGIAALSLRPGGVSIFGAHWEHDPKLLERRSA